VEIPVTAGGKVFTDISKIPHSRETLIANRADEGENNVLLGGLLPAHAEHPTVHAQGEKLCWCHHAWPQQAQRGATCHSELYQGKCRGSGGGLAGLSSRYGFDDSVPHGEQPEHLKYPSSARWRFCSSSEKYHRTLCFALVLANTWAHLSAHTQQSCRYAFLN